LAEEEVVLPVGVEIGAGDETTGTSVVGTTTGATGVVGFTTTGAGVFDVVVDVELLVVCSMRTAGACVLMGTGVFVLEVVAGAGTRTGIPWDVTVATSTGAPVEKEVP
jgi:hypothetical protein